MLDPGGAAHFLREGKSAHSLPQWTQLRELFSATRYSLTQGQISSLEAQSLSPLVLIWAALKSPLALEHPMALAEAIDPCPFLFSSLSEHLHTDLISKSVSQDQ